MKIELNKRNHPVNNTYVCNDCVFVFTVHTPVHKNKQLFCPNCGDTIAVVPFIKDDKKKKEWKPWTDEEYTLVDRIISGELLKYQVAATIGRTYGAVQRKVENRTRERERNAEN